ncbi:MAG: hypothetical protein U1E22_01600 [Coriobacteriia bacterium]|nr:hypothetical protein [Coriobacteriia bacterium]
MIRINLLPREIIEKRKFERMITFVAIGGLAVFVIVAAVWGVMAWQVAARNSLLQAEQGTAATLRSSAEALKVFEDKEGALESRLSIAREALAERADWGRIVNEFSLVLPSDVWLDALSGDEESGLTIDCSALDSVTDAPDFGHKAVAKTLVRLADLELVDDVWLVSSTKGVYAETEDKVITFSITTGVVRPAAPDTTTTSSEPAPPSQSAQ